MVPNLMPNLMVPVTKLSSYQVIDLIYVSWYSGFGFRCLAPSYQVIKAVSYTVLTPIFQEEKEIEEEQEEERGCQGGGETLSAGAEPLSVLKGERNHFKKDQIQN